MDAVELTKKDVLIAYADEQYKKLQREKDQYISLDEFAPNAASSKSTFSWLAPVFLYPWRS